MQESIYRLLGLKMTKSTVIIKYVSTDIFHFSPQRYYEFRPKECIDGITYAMEEEEKGYREDISFTEFWSMYDIVYENSGNKKERPKNHIPL